VILTPDKDPFFGGTYFPARDGDRGARKGFLTILRELRAEYEANRGDIVARAQQLSQRIEAASTPSPPGNIPGAAAIEQAVRGAAASFDPSWGGFGQAPKFPRPVLLELLLRYQRRTGDQHALEMVSVTLERMAAGGMHDHVGGGFHRYSTDARWLVPHFEKMLYDNAQLVPLYLEAYQATGRERFAEVARDTLRYVAREMTAAGGAFFSATDADSRTPSGHEEEGYFFTWAPSELKNVLSADRVRTVSAYFGVTAAGNFEGRNILHTPQSDEAVARDLGVSAGELGQTIADAREELYRARTKRPPPHTDDKILTSWNGLMISAFARAALVLGNEDHARRAERAADFVLRALRSKDGRLLRSFKDGRANHAGYLDDYAFLIQGLLDLYEATADGRRIEQAMSLQAILDRHFWDNGSGGYFMTSDSHERLFARDKPTYDGAEPSGNSVALMNALRLYELTTNDEYRARAEQAFAAFSRDLARSPGASPKMLAALEYYLDRPLEVFIVRPEPGANAEPLLSRFRRTHLPNRVFTLTTEGEKLDALSRLVPGLEGKRALRGNVTAFVCERGRCELPTSEPAVFARQLTKVHALPAAAPPR
ncbi:MAG TPA: thioredoxin domain-containing protein, partial [Candidatus Krumholzibacteria bacterium]